MAVIQTASRSHEVALQGAILLYGTGPGQFSYATAHRIEAEASGRPVIGAGVPLNRMALIHAVREVAEHALPKGEFLTPDVLSISPSAVTWWCPAARRRVFFKCKELGERSAIVSHPALVFQASQSGFKVFALKGQERPVPEANCSSRRTSTRGTTGRSALARHMCQSRSTWPRLPDGKTGFSTRRSPIPITAASASSTSAAPMPSGRTCWTVSFPTFPSKSSFP